MHCPFLVHSVQPVHSPSPLEISRKPRRVPETRGVFQEPPFPWLSLSYIYPHPSPFLSITISKEHTHTKSSSASDLTAMSIVRRSNIFDPFSPDLRDPFEGFPFFSGGGSALSFPRAFPSPSSLAFPGEVSAFVGARFDWKETPEAHVFKADLPGIKKGEVKVEVEDGNVLQISGERTREQEEKTDIWHRVERSSGQFQRRFRLPENTKLDGIKATMENGVLTVTVPKAVVVEKPQAKSIDISG